MLQTLKALVNTTQLGVDPILQVVEALVDGIEARYHFSTQAEKARELRHKDESETCPKLLIHPLPCQDCSTVRCGSEVHPGRGMPVT
jgi:hypothetical protein